MRNKIKRRSFFGGLFALGGLLLGKAGAEETKEAKQEEWENSFVILSGRFDASGYTNCTGLCGVKVVCKFSPEPDVYKTHRAELPPWRFHRFAIELDDEQSEAFVDTMERWTKTRKMNLER